MNDYRIFTRTWWKNNPSWPDGLEPHAGRKYTIGMTSTEEEARQMCKNYNVSVSAEQMKLEGLESDNPTFNLIINRIHNFF